MHATKEIVHAEIRHEDGHECQCHIQMIVSGLVQPVNTLMVYGHAIDHEGDECPCLLGVPAPVCSPRDICPDGTDKDTVTQTGEGRVEKQL